LGKISVGLDGLDLEGFCFEFGSFFYKELDDFLVIIDAHGEVERGDSGGFWGGVDVGTVIDEEAGDFEAGENGVVEGGACGWAGVAFVDRNEGVREGCEAVWVCFVVEEEFAEFDVVFSDRDVECGHLGGGFCGRKGVFGDSVVAFPVVRVGAAGEEKFGDVVIVE
jgi:hypothetical protein